MADVKISALPAASALTGTELVPIVQGGVTVQSTPAAFVSNGTLAGSFTQVGVGTSTPGSFGKLAVLSSGAPTTAYAAIMSSVAGYNSSWESTLYLGSARTDTVNNNAIAGYRIKNYGADANGSYLAIEAGSSPSTSPAPPTTYTERLRLDASGNLGLGVTPSAWTGGFKPLQILNSAVAAYNDGAGNIQTEVETNAYQSSLGVYKYIVNGAALQYRQVAGIGHSWSVAPSGTAGNAISFTQAMTLDASGRLLVGTTTAAAKLTVDSLGDSYAVFSGRDGSSVGGDIQIKRSSSATAVGTGPNIYLDDGTANNTNLIQAGSGNLQFFNFSTGSWTERMRLDASGNLGLGVTPSAWGSNYKAIQNPAGGIGAYSTASVAYAQNAYDSGVGAWKYLTTGIGAGFYNQSLGTHTWYNAPSGTAGNAISFTQAMTLDASGNLGVGTVSPAFNAGSGVHIYRSSGATLRIQDASTDFDILSFSGNANLVNRSNGALTFGTNNAEKMRLDSSGNLITNVNAAAPSLSTNSTMSFELTSNTSLKVVVRGTDGVTRSVSLTLS